MIVTRIERQKRHARRVNIYLDDVFAFGLDEEVLVRYGLRTGDALDEGTHHALLTAEEHASARQAALRFLSYRLRSEREIRTKLAEKEFTPATVERVVDQLRSAGMLDDRRFALAFVHDARMRRPTGERLLRQQLLLKGIARPLIDEVLADESAGTEERGAALQAARAMLKKYRTSRKGSNAATQRSRLAQFLARRGFGWNVITPVLRSLFPAIEQIAEENEDGSNRF